jgi:hypothetical protein
MNELEVAICDLKKDDYQKVTFLRFPIGTLNEERKGDKTND